MEVKKEYSDKAKEIVSLFNQHLESISKFKIERFKDTFLIYVILPNVILNVRVGDKLIVDLDNKLKQLTLDFYSNQRTFDSIIDFTAFFRSLHSSLIDRNAGIYVTYKGEEVLCNVEVSSIDSDRQMGQEVIYDITLYDEEIDENIVAIEVSEYPMGSFNIFDAHQDVKFDDGEVLNYFYRQNEEPPNMDFDF